MGFMVKGAPNQIFDIEYSLTFEYISTNNTDLVPHAYGPAGDPRTVIGGISNINRASMDGPSSLDWLLTTAHNIAGSIG